MRQIAFVLIALVVGFSSSAAAISPYLGIQADLPGLFGNYGGVGVPMFGVRFGADFDQPASGFGARVSFSTLLLALRAGLEAYYRIPMDASGSNLYLGAGVAGWGALFVGGGWTDVHGLIGFESPLSPGTLAFLEVSPGVAIDGGRTLYGDPSGLGFTFYPYAGQPAITLSAGLTFRL